VPAFAGSAPHTIHPDHFPADAGVQIVPAMLGSVLLFSSYTPHRSMENRAGIMRWAADLRLATPHTAPRSGLVFCFARP
jgi:ectoine hydroxylase-related dioxygenase (phytanoyl-CoA dioxygenase family)